MEKETLKKLIEIEYERSETISQFKSSVFRLIDMYESDNTSAMNPIYNPISYSPEMVPYSEICPCNPKNGGSGMCGCTIGNTMVKK